MPTALVTGASRGLGLGTATSLARLGHRVLLTARRLDAATSAAAGVPGDVRPLALDVADPDAIGAFLAALDEPVDVLVNNAGVIAEAARPDTLAVPAEAMLLAFRTNALGPFLLAQGLLGAMNARGFGRVVNVSTGMAGLADMDGGWPAYRASTAALNAVTRVLHAAAAPNVKVNSVCPGWVRTAMGGPRAPRSLDEGVAGLVWAATLPADGPSGGFFRDGRPIAW